MESIQTGAIGAVLRIKPLDSDGEEIDYSDATTLNIIIGYPDGTTSSKTGSFTTDGTDGLIQYATITGDLSMTGPHTIQGRFRKTGLDIYSKRAKVTVADNIA